MFLLYWEKELRRRLYVKVIKREKDKHSTGGQDKQEKQEWKWQVWTEDTVTR